MTKNKCDKKIDEEQKMRMLVSITIPSAKKLRDTRQAYTSPYMS